MHIAARRAPQPGKLLALKSNGTFVQEFLARRQLFALSQIREGAGDLFLGWVRRREPNGSGGLRGCGSGGSPRFFSAATQPECLRAVEIRIPKIQANLAQVRS